MAGSRISRVDALIALALLVFGQLEVIIFGVAGDPTAAHLLWAAAAASALFRRTHPFLLVVIASVMIAVRFRYGLTPMGGTVSSLYGSMALYGAGAYARGPLRAVALGLSAVMLATLARYAVTEAGYGPMVGVPIGEWVGSVFISFAAAAGGIVLRDRSHALAEARRRAAGAPTERETVAAAVADERAVVARELQALVAAAVREIFERVRSARDRIGESAAEAQQALASARSQSRTALAEMRRMLSLLRSAEDDAAEASRLAQPRPVGGLERLLAPIPDSLRRQGMPLFVLVVGIVDAATMSVGPPDYYGEAGLAPRLLGAIAVAAAFVPRRRFPLLTVIAIAALVILRPVAFDDYFGLNVPLYVGAFAVGLYGRSFATSFAGGAILAASAVLSPIIEGFPLPLGSHVFIVVTTLAAWAVGFAGRERMREADEIHTLAEAEEDLRLQAARRAVVDERLRVARDLHDLVGHGLTAIVLQCAVGERFASTDPARARAAIAEVIGATHTTLDELDQLLSALGGEASDPPALTAVPDLVERARASGLTVDLDVSGDLARVPAGPSAAGYRIVQEALTNAAKYGSRGGPAAVEVDSQGEGISIRVTNELRPGFAGAGRRGHGLLGMSERVRLYLGELRAGPEGGSAWVVNATIPTAIERAEFSEVGGESHLNHALST